MVDLERLEQLAETSSRYANMLVDYAANEQNREIARYARDLASSKLHGVVAGTSRADVREWTEIYWRAMKTMAQNGDFESYMLYLERRRPAKERFYMPRRKQLHPIVYQIQRLLDDELDELFLSMPPRVGKTTLLLFLMTYIIGMWPELHNLYTAYSGGVTGAMYDGVLEVLRDPLTYCWAEIFPGREIAKTNAVETCLDIGRAKRYNSLTCRSIEATMNGSLDCDGFTVADDLIEGIDEALSPQRLAGKWSRVDNNYIPRAKMQCKRLWVGTRWATKDPAGIRMELLRDRPEYANVRWTVINTPALNEQDESNFDYLYSVGYDTSYYHQRRASFEYNNDMASWLAQYMGEPIDRIGTLISVDDIQTYNGVLPDGEPDAKLMAVDVAYGGSDALCAPVGYVYGDSVYITSVVFDTGDRDITRPRVARQIAEQDVRRAQFERNNGGDMYREDIEKILNEQYSVHVAMSSKSAPTTKRKHERILEYAPDMRKVYYLEERLRDKDYRMFMSNLLSYPIEGNAKHDDAPDGLAQLLSMVTRPHKGGVKTFRRKW